MKSYIVICSILLFFWGNLGAQEMPAPAPAQKKGIALSGGTAHLGNGQVIENALVAFDKGVLTYVGQVEGSTFDLNNYDILDVADKHVYPGLILANSDLGLVEVSAVRASRDARETGVLNPSIRSIPAYNTDSELIPTTRFNGILLAQITPQGGIVSGQSSIVQLDAWNWEDAIVKVDEGIHMNWPSRMQRPRWWLGETAWRKNESYGETLRAIEQVLADGKAYVEMGEAAPVNLKLEAMRGLYDGSKTMYLHENNVKEIIQGIQILKKHGIQKVVLVGGNDAYYAKDLLKEHKIPVILSNVHRLPSREGEDIDWPFRMPGLLHKEGILVSIAYNGISNSRNLPFTAGTCATYGLNKEEALQLITLNAAKILGIEDKMGSIEKGKSATVIVSEGDILDMRSNKIEFAYIDGRSVNLNNKHTELYRKYRDKYAAQK